MLRLAIVASMLVGCVPPATPTTPSYFYYVPAGMVVAPMPILPLDAYPPPPFYHYPAPAPVAEVELETPSLAVRALSSRVSEAASAGDCAAAIAAGDELEKLHADSHHALLAVDQRYAACIRGF